jgi:hypothetical protein
MQEKSSSRNPFHPLNGEKMAPQVSHKPVFHISPSRFEWKWNTNWRRAIFVHNCHKFKCWTMPYRWFTISWNNDTDRPTDGENNHPHSRWQPKHWVRRTRSRDKLGFEFEIETLFLCAMCVFIIKVNRFLYWLPARVIRL